MISIYTIFTALATTALAKGSLECNFTDRTRARCFVAEGQMLIFHLPSTANTTMRLLKDNKSLILKISKDTIESFDEEYLNQPELFTNGTCKVGAATKRHSGDYMLEQFGHTGASVKKVTVHLEIQAPVTKPVVSQMCLSPEQMNISCSSEGDGVQFKLTLNGLLLMQTSVSNVTISLHGQLMGNLMCHVWNNVSRDETVIHLTSCKGFYSFPVMTVTVTVTASVVTVLLFVGLCLAIRNLNKPRPTTVNNDNADVVYTEVRVKKNARRNRPNSHQNASSSTSYILNPQVDLAGNLT